MVHHPDRQGLTAIAVIPLARSMTMTAKSQSKVRTDLFPISLTRIARRNRHQRRATSVLHTAIVTPDHPGSREGCEMLHRRLCWCAVTAVTLGTLVACAGDDTTGGSSGSPQSGIVDATIPDAIGGGMDAGGETSLNSAADGAPDATTSVVASDGGHLDASNAAVDSGSFSKAITDGGLESSVTIDAGHDSIVASGVDSGLDDADGGEIAASISAGNAFACVVTTDGKVWCWGDNSCGELGTAGEVPYVSATPLQVQGLPSAVTSVSAGGCGACAVTATGGVMCWGSGALGNGSTTPRSAPIQVTGLTSGVTAVSVGLNDYACAITASAGVECWGSEFGQFVAPEGGTTNLVPMPFGGLSGVTGISVGGDTACAVSQGGLYCWGQNAYGQLGNGATLASAGPVPVMGLTSGVASVSVGNTTACAVTTSGGVQCWGNDGSGQLYQIPVGGNGSPITPVCNGTDLCSSTPINIMGLTSGVSSVSAGDIASGSESICALQGDTVACWGNGFQGIQGPTQISGLTSEVASVSVGGGSLGLGNGEFACAVTTAGGVECWGSNGSGQLGPNSSATYTLVPVAVPGFGVSRDN